MTKIADVVFKDNSSQRTPCVIVVDGSTSMEGDPIDNLNAALKEFEAALKSDAEAADHVQVKIIRLGGRDEVESLTEWVDAADFSAPDVEANGNTPLGKAIDLAMSEIQKQKEIYKQNGIPYTRPWLFVFTDGEPTDDWEEVAERCKREQEDRRFVLWPIAVGGDARVEILQAFCGPDRKVIRTEDVKFREMFVWLAASLAATSRSVPGQQVALPNPMWVVPT